MGQDLHAGMRTGWLNYIDPELGPIHVEPDRLSEVRERDKPRWDAIRKRREDDKIAVKDYQNQLLAMELPDVETPVILFKGEHNPVGNKSFMERREFIGWYQSLRLAWNHAVLQIDWLSNRQDAKHEMGIYFVMNSVTGEWITFKSILEANNEQTE